MYQVGDFYVSEETKGIYKCECKNGHVIYSSLDGINRCTECNLSSDSIVGVNWNYVYNRWQVVRKVEDKYFFEGFHALKESAINAYSNPFDWRTILIPYKKQLSYLDKFSSKTQRVRQHLETKRWHVIFLNLWNCYDIYASHDEFECLRYNARLEKFLCKNLADRLELLTSFILNEQSKLMFNIFPSELNPLDCVDGIWEFNVIHNNVALKFRGYKTKKSALHARSEFLRDN